MTRQKEDLGADALARDDLQKVLAKWGTSPVPLAAADVAEARRQRGGITLRAAIGSAKRERQTRRMRFALAAVAASTLAVWGGLRLLGPATTGDRIAATSGRVSGVSTPPSSAMAGSAMAGSAMAGSAMARDFGPGSTVMARSFVEGPHEVAQGEAGWALGSPNRVLESGDRIRALDRAIEVTLNRITSAHLVQSSVLAIAALEERRQELQLLSGQAEFEVDPKRAAEVIVHAASARIRVTGTAFSVAVGETGRTAWSEVVVKLGRVEIVDHDQRFVIEAGESWSSRDFATAPETLADRREWHRDPKPGTQKRGSTASGLGSEATSSGARGGAVRSPADDGDDAPLTTLSEENRLFRSALAARNAGSHGRCVHLLSDLLAKFPASPLRQEAIVAQFRCLRSSGQTKGAHRTALRYLSEYPNGFAREEARGLVLEAAATP